MFRDMRRIKQQISEEACIEILENEPRGVLAVTGEDGYPYAFPMNHIYLDGKLYFHCAKIGHKIDAMNADNKVSFCIMDAGFKKEGEWSLNINSVVVFGTMRMLEDETECVDIVRQLGIKHYPSKDSVEEVIKQTKGRIQIMELTIDHMTGKLVNES